MTYDAKETGAATGNPIYLYRFTRNGVDYDYCSLRSDLVVVTPAGTFSASSLKHNSVNIPNAANNDALDITFPISDAFAYSFLLIDGSPDETTVTVWRGHYDDPDTEFVTVFAGRVMSAKPNFNGTVVLRCSSILSKGKNKGLAPTYHRTCRHAVYHGKCGLAKATFEVAGTVDAISGLVLTITAASAEADGWYRGGILEFGGTQVMITAHTGSSITVRRLPASLIVTSAVTIARGCDRAFQTCIDKFSNSQNFGGWPFMPIEDPWNDGSVV